MRKVSTILDFIIYDFFIFILLLIFFGSFTNGYFPLALSIVGLVGFSVLFFKIRGRVFKKKKHASDTLKKQKLVETSLLYQTSSECLNFFKDFFFSVQGLELEVSAGFLQSDETVVFPYFENIEMSFQDALKISKIARELSAKHLIIPCIKKSFDVDFLSRMFETVSIFESNSLFEKMVEFDYFPTMIDEKVLPKKSLKNTFSSFGKREKARGFGLIGLSLFAFSFLSPFKTYYLIASFLLLSLSAFLILKGKR